MAQGVISVWPSDQSRGNVQCVSELELLTDKTGMANFDVRTQISTSALFKELSWLTNIVFSTKQLGRACSGTPWAKVFLS